ncbi:hypothetical protein [Kitasatospora aureofaciens]|uniref:hypothetical protein n=1 Tax=Kitasatospora aureofaciens TaxID=1894 RepID=UPI000524F85B|nr:hypothetical protein [Kitasatospora aureofaciens]
MSATAARQLSRAAAMDVRLVRAAAFATASVALASAAHGAAGGVLGPGEMVGGWVLTWAAAAALAGRRRSLPAITAVMLLGQLGLHLLFQAGSALVARTPAASSTRGMEGMPGMDGGSGYARSPAAAPSGSVGQHLHGAHAQAAAAVHAVAHHPGLLGLSHGMLAGHAAAALGTGWLLHRVEAALWRLLDAARAMRAAARRWGRRFADALARLGNGAAVRTWSSSRTVLAPQPDAGPHLPVFLRHSVIRRGPPWGVCA